jgi:hypothetical protein
VQLAFQSGQHTGRMVGLDLKHLGLIASVGVAVALRFFSDFSFATIEHQASLANLPLSRFSFADVAGLSVNSLTYQLQRDWFNLSPQAPPEIAGLLMVLVLAYGLLRLALAPAAAAAATLLLAPFLSLGATVGACAWVLARAARAG